MNISLHIMHCHRIIRQIELVKVHHSQTVQMSNVVECRLCICTYDDQPELLNLSFAEPFDVHFVCTIRPPPSPMFVNNSVRVDSANNTLVLLQFYLKVAATCTRQKYINCVIGGAGGGGVVIFL